ncbi:MAG: hypothetical protein J5697_00855 [Clostridia bacterium]|nr:hypothetical protein [Clostridia bacterium]
MKILSRKLGAIALLAVTAIVAFAIGVATIGAKPTVVQADVELPSNIVFKNIEDCVYDITASTINGGIQYAHALEGKDCSYLSGSQDIVLSNEKGQDKINSVNKVTSDTFYVGVYDRKYRDGDTYTFKDVDYTCNFNKYDGNISIFTTTASQRKFHHNCLAFYLNGAENSMVTFRMLYQAGYEYNFKDNVISATNLNQYYAASIESNGEVNFWCSGKDNDYTTYSAATLLSALQEREPSATALYETDDELLVTFGTFHTDVDTDDAHTNYYFKVVNETKGYTAYELLVEKDYYYYTNGHFAIEFYGINARTLKFAVSGVNKPLFANYNYTAEDDLNSNYVGESATTVPLKTNYSHVDGNEQVLALGTNNISVNYNQGEYYGNTDPVPARATINIVANDVVIKDTAGVNINVYADQVKTFELPVLDRDKSFIAYMASDGKLYKQGESITLDGDKTITLIESDAEFLGKVDLRLSDDEFGGVRFCVKILTEDYVALQSADIGIAFKIAGAEVELVPYSQSGDYSLAYIAKTDIAAADFNTNIAAEITVDYESGAAAVLTANANLYQLASSLAAQNETAISNGQALYNGTAALRLQKYLNAVNG